MESKRRATRPPQLVAQLDKGADFDELMAEYGEDPGMVSQPEGYVIDQAVSFDPAFLETAFSIKSTSRTVAPVP